MKKSKLYLYLILLSKKELREFRDYVSSPFLNGEKVLITFLEAFIQTVLQSRAEDVSKEIFLKTHYPDGNYSSDYIDARMSELLTLLKKYLSYKAYERDEAGGQAYLLEELNHKGFDKDQEFQRLMKQGFKAINKRGARDANYYQDRLRLGIEHYNYSARKPKRSGDPGLQELIDNLDQYYLLKKLNYACLAANQAWIIPTEYKIEGLDYLVGQLETQNEDDSPLPRIYLYIYHCLRQEEPDRWYPQLRTLLEENATRFPNELVRGLYTYAITICNQQWTRGKLEYQNEIARHYNYLLDHGILSQKGKLSAADFKNIVTLMSRMGAKTGDFSWVRAFLDKYQDKVMTKNPEKNHRFGRAILLYYQNDYPAAYRELASIENRFSDPYLELNRRLYMLKVLYELRDEEGEWQDGEKDRFETEVEACRMAVARNKGLSQDAREGYMEFIKVLKRIYHTSGKENLDWLKRVQEDLTKDTEVRDRGWLLEKVKEYL